MKRLWESIKILEMASMGFYIKWNFYTTFNQFLTGFLIHITGSLFRECRYIYIYIMIIIVLVMDSLTALNLYLYWA